MQALQGRELRELVAYIHIPGITGRGLQTVNSVQFYK